MRNSVALRTHAYMVRHHCSLNNIVIMVSFCDFREMPRRMGHLSGKSQEAYRAQGLLCQHAANRTQTSQ
jgi:hypothetical protein